MLDFFIEAMSINLVVINSTDYLSGCSRRFNFISILLSYRSYYFTDFLFSKIQLKSIQDSLLQEGGNVVK